ncbi:hypothetical protein [Ottowia caeni]
MDVHNSDVALLAPDPYPVVKQEHCWPSAQGIARPRAYGCA